jgi:hypothetical protein
MPTWAALFVTTIRKCPRDLRRFSSALLSQHTMVRIHFANKMNFGVYFGSIWIKRLNRSQANKIFLKLSESIR